MKVEKKIIGNLTKCYSIAPLYYNGSNHFLVAAEKTDRCILFDLDGREEETVWTEPGGVMTMVQVPGTDGQFLATHKFYSPNDSKEAKIVIAAPSGTGKWDIRTLVDLPFVHRFDILVRGGVRYLIACTLKSGHEYKDDWSSPGKVYAAVLPEDLSGYNESRQLELTVIMDGMLKNHGYCRVEEQKYDSCVISAENGIYQFYPPEEPGMDWKIVPLLMEPASDAVLVDLDGDGSRELAVITPFHGETIRIYKKIEKEYERVYEYEKPAEFSHAIFGGMVCGKPAVIIGHRNGERNLLAFTYEKGGYQAQVLDQGCGSANVYRYSWKGKDVLVSANRETDEIAMYLLTP